MRIELLDEVRELARIMERFRANSREHPRAKEKSEQRSRVAKLIEPATATPPHATVKQVDYTVKGGDALSLLALDFYGNSSQWTRIHDANRQVIIGQKITIPYVL